MKFRIFIALMLFSVSSFAQDLAKTRTEKKAGQDSEIYPSFTFDGAWCWYSDPRAVYFEGIHKRTYSGWVDRYGDIHVGYYDHETGVTDTRVIFDGLQVDDHDNPSILFDDEGKLLIFFSKHSGANPLYLCRSEEPESINTIGEADRLALNDLERYPDMRDSYTYSHPIRLSGEEGRIYIFWRGIDFKPSYAWSDDNGISWSKGGMYILPERIYNMRRPYVKVSSDGHKRIHFAFTDGHPRNEDQNSIYYMYYEAGSLFKAGGEKIGDLGDEIQPRQADCVYDAIISNEKAWIWDIASDGEGNPVIAYAKFPDDMHHIYSYARWNGKEWSNTDLVDAGSWFPETKEGVSEREPNYSGGITIDKENAGIVYLSVNRDTVFEIEKWQTKNDGKSWMVSPITKGSSKNNVRPFAVRNAAEDNPLQVLWMCNTRYVHYTDYHTSIQMSLKPEPQAPVLEEKGILEIMHRVADWQIMNPRKPHKLDWHYGAFYTGLWALYQSTGEERYKNEIKNLGQKNDWKIRNDIYHADRLTVAQSYAEIYMEEKNPEMIENIQWVMDMHIDRKPKADVRHDGNPYRGEWWTWCDALYMAPPAFARIYAATGKEKYLKYLDKHWWLTSDYMYSSADSLYFRDDRFFDQLTENGKKIFWSRGNGWVIAGIARTLMYMPEDYPNRIKFENQFREMAAKLLRIQDEDGLWRVSLIDPEYLDMGESSGSSFFTFAFAWGINNGLLDRKEYGAALEKAWTALCANVNEAGRLGYVQQVAGSPYPFYDNQSHVYASGAFIQAGSEMLTYLK